MLQILGKLLEKLLSDSMYSHVFITSLISVQQSSFHPEDSTIDYLLSITHKIYTDFEESPNREAYAVFIFNFSTAGDKALCLVLFELGIRF